MSLSVVYAELRSACAAAGGQAAWAKKAGISPQYVSDVVNGRKDPGPGMLAALGLRKRVIYEPIPAKRGAA